MIDNQGKDKGKDKLSHHASGHKYEGGLQGTVEIGIGKNVYVVPEADEPGSVSVIESAKAEVCHVEDGKHGHERECCCARRQQEVSVEPSLRAPGEDHQIPLGRERTG